MNKINSIIGKYQGLISEHPDLAEAIESLKAYEKKAKELVGEMSIAQGILAHEIRNPLQNILSATSYLKGVMVKESRENRAVFEILERGVRQINALTSLLYLEGLSKEELIESSQWTNLENLARSRAILNSEFMVREQIGLNLKYDRVDGKPIQIYFHEGALNAIWGTLTMNALSWAESFSKINQGIRFDKKKDLEIIMENTYTEVPLRKVGGLGRGLGVPFVRKIINTLGGKVTTYRTPRINKLYDFCETFGYLDGNNPKENETVYGVQITIPQKELEDRV